MGQGQGNRGLSPERKAKMIYASQETAKENEVEDISEDKVTNDDAIDC